MLEHKHRVLLCVLEPLEQEQGFLVVGQASLNPGARGAKTNEHGVVLPVVVVDLVFLECGREDFVGRVFERDFEGFEVVRGFLTGRPEVWDAGAGAWVGGLAEGDWRVYYGRR